MDKGVILSIDKTDGPSDFVKEHLILGTDESDAEMQRDLWLSENPSIKIVRIHDVKREPPTLLMRIGSMSTFLAFRSWWNTRSPASPRNEERVHERLDRRNNTMMRKMPMPAVIRTPVRISSRSKPA